MTDIPPADFPRDAPEAALAGWHPKMALIRTADGRYIPGITDAEWTQRYDICSDLVNQLDAYFHRKHKVRPEWSADSLIQKIREAIVRKQWVLTEAELDWIIARLRERVAGPRLGVAAGAFKVPDSIDSENEKVRRLFNSPTREGPEGT